MTERPGLLKGLFALKVVNREGLFSAYVYQDGARVEIIVDNYIPCLEDAPVFSHSETNELWVMILEKIWAKMVGSYEAMVEGSVHEALRDLLGAPSYEYNIEMGEAASRVLEILKTGHQKKYLMAAGATTEDSEACENQKAIGLNPLYSFAVLGVFTVKKDDKEVDLIHLRNPWGKLEWTGDWSETSECWTAAIKRHVGWKDPKEGGNFWMNYEDFVKHFSRLSVCKYDKWYKFSSCFGESREINDFNQTDYHLFKLDIPYAGEHTLAIS